MSPIAPESELGRVISIKKELRNLLSKVIAITNPSNTNIRTIQLKVKLILANIKRVNALRSSYLQLVERDNQSIDAELNSINNIMTSGVIIKDINENISSQTLNLLMDNLNTLSLHITRAINQTHNHILFLDTHARLAMASSHLPSSPSSLRTSPGLPLPLLSLPPPPPPSPPSLSPHPLSPPSLSPHPLSPRSLSPHPLFPQAPGLTRQRAIGRDSLTIFLPPNFPQPNLDRSPAHPSLVQSPRHSSVSSSTSSSDHEDVGFGLKYHKKRSNKRANYTKNYTKRRETRSSKMKKKATKARSLRKPRRTRLL
jgi:hypothetical protein